MKNKDKSTVDCGKKPRTEILSIIILLIATLFLGLLASEKIILTHLTLQVLAVCGAIIIVWMSIFDVNKVFLLMVLYLPFSYLFPGGFGVQVWAFNLTNLFILAIWMGLIFRAMSARAPVKAWSALSTWLVVFVLFSIGSFVKGTAYFGSFYFQEFISPLKEWLTPIIIFFVSMAVINDRKVMKDTAVVIMCVVVMISLLTIRESLNLGFASDIDKMRAGGVFEQPNIAGAFFVYYSFLFPAFLLCNGKRWRYWLLLAPFFLAVQALIYTYSRGAMLAFAVSSLVVAFVKNKLIFLVLTGVIVLMLIVPGLMPQAVKDRFLETFNPQQEEIYQQNLETSLETSARQRVMIWKGAAEMIKQYPFWGVGYGVFPYMIPTYADVGIRDAHNAYIIIATEMGLVTLTVFFVVLWIIFKNTWWVFRRVNDSTIKAIALGFLGGFVGFLVCNIFGSRFEMQSLSGLFWILVAIMIKARYLKQKGLLD